MSKLSRRKISEYIAEQVLAGNTDVAIKELAAYLIESRRTREAELIVRSIEDELAKRGMVVANVTTATKLDKTLTESIKEILGAKKLAVRENVDESVIGGVKVEAPGVKLDATIRNRINNLQNAKI